MAGIANMGLGLTQLWDAQNMFIDAGNRPTYEIPDAIKSLMSDSELLKAQGLPAAQQKLMADNIAKQQTGLLQGIASRKGGLTGVAAAGQQAADAYNQIGVLDAQAQRENQKIWQQNQKIGADYQDQAWMLNKMLPWQEMTNRAWDLKETADQNTTEGANSIIDTITGLGGLGG